MAHHDAEDLSVEFYEFHVLVASADCVDDGSFDQVFVVLRQGHGRIPLELDSVLQLDQGVLLHGGCYIGIVDYFHQYQAIS